MGASLQGSQTIMDLEQTCAIHKMCEQGLQDTLNYIRTYAKEQKAECRRVCTYHIAIYAPLRGTRPELWQSQALHHRVERCIAPAVSEGGLLGVDDEHCLLITDYCLRGVVSGEW